MHNERGILVEDVLGPYNEGAELMLTCSVSGGKSVSAARCGALQARFIVKRCLLLCNTIAFFGFTDPNINMMCTECLSSWKTADRGNEKAE